VTTTVLLLHGPNLNLLGEREPDVYGTATLDDHVATARAAAEAAGPGVVGERARVHDDRRAPVAGAVDGVDQLALEHLQSNHEGELVEAIHAARGRCAAIIVNPGALTHYAWSLHDALAAFDGVVVELHLSNPNAREPWRHTSVIAPVATGTIAGFGGHGYALAVEAVSRSLA
jgi:3-dehydroquinate dehydratase II